MKQSFFLKQAVKEVYKLPFFELARRNSSFLSLIPFNPVSGFILLSHTCNCKCVMCSMWRKKSHDDLTTEEVFDILLQLKKMNFRRVVFSGGEALIRNDLPLLIKRAKNLGFERICILTNGLLLSERIEDLLKSGLNEVSLSLDGSKDVHDVLRGVNGVYDKCILGLESLRKLRATKYPYVELTIAFTLMKQSSNDLLHVLELCKQFDASLMLNLFDTRQFLFRGREDDSFFISDQETLDEIIGHLHLIKKRHKSLLNLSHMGLEYAKTYFQDSKKESIPCVSGYLNVYIDSNGDVFSGCWVLPSLGNIRKRKLSDILYSKKYEKRLDAMFHKNCPGCGCGYLTNLWYNVPSTIQEACWLVRLFGK